MEVTALFPRYLIPGWEGANSISLLLMVIHRPEQLWDQFFRRTGFSGLFLGEYIGEYSPDFWCFFLLPLTQ
jgi:hypothetical protein